MVEEQDLLSIYCPNCWKNHLLRECLANVKSANKCVICTRKHPTNECPYIPRLKAAFEGEHPEPEPLHTMGARKSWPRVGTSMIPEHAPHFFGYNVPSYSYHNENHSKPS